MTSPGSTRSPPAAFTPKRLHFRLSISGRDAAIIFSEADCQIRHKRRQIYLKIRLKAGSFSSFVSGSIVASSFPSSLSFPLSCSLYPRPSVIIGGSFIIVIIFPPAVSDVIIAASPFPSLSHYFYYFLSLFLLFFFLMSPFSISSFHSHRPSFRLSSIFSFTSYRPSLYYSSTALLLLLLFYSHYFFISSFPPPSFYTSCSCSSYLLSSSLVFYSSLSFSCSLSQFPYSLPSSLLLFLLFSIPLFLSLLFLFPSLPPSFICSSSPTRTSSVHPSILPSPSHLLLPNPSP